MDVTLKLRELRRMRGLSQKEVAKLSGVGEKTISSFETGKRIGSLRLRELKKLLRVYGLTEAEFFGHKVELQLAPWELADEEVKWNQLLERIQDLPAKVREILLGRFSLVVETLIDTHELLDPQPEITPLRIVSG